MDFDTLKIFRIEKEGRITMKTVFSGVCVVILGLTFYFAQNSSTGVRTPSAPQQSVQNREEGVTVAQKSSEKKCACCNQKSSPAQEKAKQRQQARETWARKTIADYGYEKGMKRITAQSSSLAKQMQRILDREKRLGQASAVSQSDTQ